MLFTILAFTVAATWAILKWKWSQHRNRFRLDFDIYPLGLLHEPPWLKFVIFNITDTPQSTMKQFIEKTDGTVEFLIANPSIIQPSEPRYFLFKEKDIKSFKDFVVIDSENKKNRPKRGLLKYAKKEFYKVWNDFHKKQNISQKIENYGLKVKRRSIIRP